MVTEGPSGDHVVDGIPNGLKYAFGLDPTVRHSPGAVPAAQFSGSNLILSYAGSSPGVTYAAQSSTDLVTWSTVPDTGTSGNHLFSVSITGHPHIFVRNMIGIAP